MNTRLSCHVALTIAGMCLLPHVAFAGEGGDILVGDIDEVVHWTADGAIGGLRAYSLGTQKCNAGVNVLDWFFTPNPNHPVTTTNLYRLHDGRFEHIGMSWVFHQFFALQSNACGFGCVPECGGNCLGTGCSSDNTAASDGQSAFLGPRSDIDANLGTNPGVFVPATGEDALSGRLQVHLVDTDPFLNINATYFVEAHSLAADDAQSGDMQFDNNNASYRSVLVDHVTGTLTLMDETQRGLPAIQAWQVADPGVELATVDIPDEGRLILGSSVTDLGGGQWHYEYALYNMSSDRSVGSVSVPVSADHVISNIGFHDVDYHSGEVYDGTDWPGVITLDAVNWATIPFESDPLSNALRWGTVYNFRFDADAPPVSSALTIGLYKPGTPASVTVAAPAPAAGCPDFADCADVDDNGVRDDNCTWWACSEAACQPTAIRFGDMGGSFGACEVDGAVDGNDRFHALNCFGNVDVDQQVGYPCEDNLPSAMNVDAGGPFGDCAPDGVCDGSDAFHALNAFEGTSPCTCPLDGAPAPEWPTTPHRVTAGVSLSTSAKVVRPGTAVEVAVFLDTPLADLRGYQLHVDSRGGQSGELLLRDITTQGTPRSPAVGRARFDDNRTVNAAGVFGGRQPWTAFNIATRQMVAGLDTPGIAIDSGYLATFVFQPSKDAHGTFVIELLSDHVDPSQRTFFFATNPTTRITVAADPVTITVD